MLHKLQTIYPVICIESAHKLLGHLFNLYGHVRKQQQQDGDDGMVGIVTSKVWHQGNPVLQLWLSVKASMLQTQSPLSAVVLRSVWWGQVRWDRSLTKMICDFLSAHLSMSFSRKLGIRPGAASNQAVLAWLLLQPSSSLGRSSWSGWSKDTAGRKSLKVCCS